MPHRSTEPAPARPVRRWTYTHAGLLAQAPLLWCAASLALGRSPMPGEPSLWSMLLGITAFIGAAVGLRETLALIVGFVQRRAFGVADPEQRRGLWAMYLSDSHPPLRRWVAALFTTGVVLLCASGADLQQLPGADLLAPAAAHVEA